MRRLSVLVSLVIGLVLASTAAPAAPGNAKHQLDVFTATVDAEQAQELLRDGVDVIAKRTVADGVELDVVLDARGRDRLAARGISVKPKRNKDGKTPGQLAAEQRVSG